jgi:hypothetical protein
VPDTSLRSLVDNTHERNKLRIDPEMTERRKRGAAGANESAALAFKKKLKGDEEILAKVVKLSDAEKKKPKDAR